MPEPTSPRPWGFRLAGLLLLSFGLLPLVNWIPSGHQYPGYRDALDRWLSGGGIALGAGVIAAITFRRYPGLWREGWWQKLAQGWQRGGTAVDATLALLATLLCSLISRLVFAARPLLIDEIIQVYQARIFAQGRLWLPPPTHPEFTSAMHLIDWGGKVYGQFPAGGPAVLALGTLAGAEWLVGPICAGASVFLLARLLRRIESAPGVALAALLLFIATPFMLFMGGTYMNHVPTLTALLAAALALTYAVTVKPEVITATVSPAAGVEGAGKGGSVLAGFLCGLALGIAATIRPTDGAAFALPTAGWLLWRARRGGPPLRILLASGVGVAIPLALLFWVNANQTGDPLRFGYIEMWGKTHELGFHEAPWGPPHTPLRGLELVNLYLLRLQTWLFESAGPGLLFATAALLLVRRVTAFERWALVGSTLLLGGYFAYWHDGNYLGPRFVYPMTPWLVLWSVRLPTVLARRGAPLVLRQGVLTTGLVSLLLGGAVYLPLRALQYHNAMLSMRFDVEALAQAQGVHNAIVLVRESWGSQLATRLWALGVTRPEADRIYRTVDSCMLDQIINRVEQAGGSSEDLIREVSPLRADSLQLVGIHLSRDTTLRYRRGSTLRPGCQRRLLEDQAGFAVFAPILLAGGSNRYVVDLHARDSLLFKQEPGREIWLVIKPPEVGADLQFTRISIDSAMAEWREPQ